MFSPSLKYTLETPLPVRLWRGLIDVWQETSISPLKRTEGDQRKIIQRVLAETEFVALVLFICLKRYLYFFFLTLKSSQALSKKPAKGHVYFNQKNERSIFSIFSSKFDRQTVSHITYFPVLYPLLRAS